MATFGYYHCPLIGIGTRQNPHRPACSSYATVRGWRPAAIPSLPDGHPVHSWALVIVSADDHGPLQADPTYFFYPHTDLNLPLPAADYSRLVLEFSGRGLTLPGPNAPLRDFLNVVGRLFDPGFDADRFTSLGG